MTDRLVELEDCDGVRIITMNRPNKLNALNTALTQQLLKALEDLASAPSVRAAVIRGEGRGFCAGADLSEFKNLTPEQSDRVLERAELTCRLQSAASQSPVPVVAAVHGATIGGGAGIALGCDMVVASRGLKLGYPETKHGIVPALVMTGLQRALGRKAAFEMVSLGRLIDADEAKELGLVNRVVDADPLPAALQIASAWAEVNPRAMAATKQLFYRVGEIPFDAAMAVGRDTNALMRSFRTEN
ncbi:enoyl-CoA hydratase/isomerase family protein [Pseudohalocynthiibacter aestuariivivens]|nr:enoyl-CoA hydratase/isomerase family protein [Pseudohalocynthiibacter aestuariivivens]QIE46256.1 enoyl-CoA hydratase/isomerase family protein [Pseudohalocynthiibacter aestuariivivens]